MEMSIPCSVCTEISENGDLWPNQKRYWSDTSQTMRAKGYWNNWSRSLPGPYPYADKFFAEVQHFLRYGISQGKEQPIFDRHANLKYKYGNRHFWARGYFVDAKESRLCKPCAETPLIRAGCANGGAESVQSLSCIKKNAKSYDLAFNIWCTSRDSNPGPTD